MGTGVEMSMSIFKLKYLIYVLIVINILLSSRWIFDGNLFFHTDIARDFLLMVDIVDNKHLVLIGPRSGAIPGLFHGPLWIYLNLPAFIIGQGNPVFVAWFWVALYISSLFIIYYVGKKMFGEEEGLLSALLLSSITALQVRSLFNPYGALLLSPLYFYTFIKYLKDKNLAILVVSLFILGLIIQFQMAFGVPVLILTLPFLVFYLIKIKRLSHIVSIFILIIPFSTYILFEMRNNFLQIKSVIGYLQGIQSHGKLGISLPDLIMLRLKESIIDGIGIITQNNIYLTLAFVILLVSMTYFIYKKNNLKIRSYFLVIYFYLGFWLLTIFFKGPVWNYYYLPFIPLLILLFVSFKNEMNKIIFYTIFFSIYAINLTNVIKDVSTYNSNPLEQDVSTWKFNKLVAEKVFAGSENLFGYFIFTPDLYGYSPSFAMDYYQKRNGKKAYSFKKEAVTYLIIAPPPEYGRDPNSIWYQKNINSHSWKSNDVRINKKPDDINSFKNGFVIEKYKLSNEEVKVEPNKYLINGIFFR